MSLQTDYPNLTHNQKLEVKASKALPAISAVVLLICSSALLIVCSHVAEMSPLFAGIAVLTGLLSMMYVALVFRTRPLYEINERGIKDNGLLGQGYGLIEWRNIQSVRTFRDKSSTSLMIKVDNFNELLDRRNFLLRPFLWVNASLSAILGGELTLPVTLGNVALSTLLHSITDFSRQSGRDVVAPPRGVIRELFAQASLVAILLFIGIVVGLIGLDFYRQWLPRWNPSLEILGASMSFPNEIPSGKSTGKLVLVDDIIVQNSGGDTKGIKVSVSGSAFDSGLLTQPHVLLQYDENQDSSSLFRKRTRELLPLHQENKNLWTGTSSNAHITTKDSTLVEAIKLFTPYGQSMYKHSIGWWTDTTSPNLTVEIFANAPRKGKGAVTVNVTPLTCPSESVSQTKQVKVTNAETYDMPLYSAGVPSDYPITLYPGGQIIFLSRAELQFDSDAKPSQIASYYKNELQHRGWKPALKKDSSMNHLELRGTKGHDKITISIEKLPGHSPVEMRVSSDR